MTDEKKRRTYRSKKDICEYWVGHPDINAVQDICWACGRFVLKLDRCHIVPRWRGGSDDVSNLHLLCRPCHQMLEDRDDYWAAFRRVPRLSFWRAIYERALVTTGGLSSEELEILRVRAEDGDRG